MNHSRRHWKTVWQFVGFLLLAVLPLLIHFAFRSFSVDGLEGRASFQSVKSALSTQKFIEIERNISNNGVRPKFDFHEVKTGGLTLLGVQGTAHFEFFNDQLMEIVFTPDSPRAGQQAFARVYGKRSSNFRHSVFLTKDGQQLIWRDQKIEGQMRSWIWNYS